MLNLSSKVKRDLLTAMDYVRDNSLITQREYNYDALGRPTTRDTRYPDRAVHHADAFTYNKRSESARRLAGRLDKSAAFAPKGRSIDGAMLSQLTGALLGEDAYAYSYDNIGNREIAQEAAEDITYDANELSQYTRISTNGEDFTPEYDADGNQILIQTSTGIWKVQYNAQNRAIKFESEDGHTVITCGYDYMGRRFEKKVVTNGTTTLHERYIYRGYLQIAAYDLREGHAEHPDLRFIIWDPTQEVAARPLAIRENGVWYTYGWDLTKNICELYGQEGFIRTIYTCSPYGQVTAEGDVIQPIQWSSEMYDAELGLVYYNYRYYNPRDGRWTRRDPEDIRASLNLYLMVYNNTISGYDNLGKCGGEGCSGECAQKCGEVKKCRKNDKGCCEKFTRKKGFESKPNGCGGEGGIHVPTWLMIFILGVSFTDACNKHDECYDKCGASREQCDEKFYQDMMNICDEILMQGMSEEDRNSAHIRCRAAASFGYKKLKKEGAQYYKAAQEKACQWEPC